MEDFENFIVLILAILIETVGVVAFPVFLVMYCIKW